MKRQKEVHFILQSLLGNSIKEATFGTIECPADKSGLSHMELF